MKIKYRPHRRASPLWGAQLRLDRSGRLLPCPDVPVSGRWRRGRGRCASCQALLQLPHGGALLHRGQRHRRSEVATLRWADVDLSYGGNVIVTRRCCMNTLWGWGRASWAGCGPDVRRGGQTLIMGYSADKSPLIGHLAGPLRRLEPLVAQRQEKCGPNRPTPTGYSCNNATRRPGRLPSGTRMVQQSGRG